MSEEIDNNNDQQTSGLLTNLNNYLAAGVHIGVKYRTKFLSRFIYKIRGDGLAIMNIQEIDSRIASAASLLADYNPEDIIVVGKKDASRKPLNVFARVVGCRVTSSRYYPGTLTNPSFRGYSEAKLVLSVDPWGDRNSIKDALDTNAVVISLANTNNTTQNIDLVVPCNNKGKKSLALIFYLLAREYCKAKNIEFDLKISDFIDKERDGERRQRQRSRSFAKRR